jgi:hypothetical protein
VSRTQICARSFCAARSASSSNAPSWSSTSGGQPRPGRRTRRAF